MKPIKYAKSVCWAFVFVAVVSSVFFGTYKLLRKEATFEEYTLTIALSSVLLHFMHEEDKEEEQ